jgi:hypothetical protein
VVEWSFTSYHFVVRDIRSNGTALDCKSDAYECDSDLICCPESKERKADLI